MVQRRDRPDRPASRRGFPLCAGPLCVGPLGAGLSIGGLAILALVTLAPPVPAQAADAPYDPFDRCAFYAGDPDYPEVSARNPKPVAGYLGDLSRVYGRPFDFIEVAPAIEHCEAAVAHPDAQPRHGYFLARAYLRHGAVDKAFPLLIETARQGEPGSVALMLDNVNNPHMKIDRAGELFPLAAKMIAPGGVGERRRYGYIFYRALDVPAVVKAPGAYRNARAMAEKFGEGGTPYLYFRRHPRSPRFTPEKGEAAAFRQRYRFLTANARADFPQIYDQLALSLLRYDAAKQGGVSLADFMAGEDVDLLGEDLQTTITERLARLGGDRRRRKDLYQWAVRVGVALGIMEKLGAAFYCNYMESFKFLRWQMMDDPGWAAFPRFKARVLTVLKTCSAPIQCRFYRARAADPFFRAAFAASRVKKRHYCPAIAGAAQ